MRNAILLLANMLTILALSNVIIFKLGSDLARHAGFLQFKIKVDLGNTALGSANLRISVKMESCQMLQGAPLPKRESEQAQQFAHTSHAEERYNNAHLEQCLKFPKCCHFIHLLQSTSFRVLLSEYFNKEQLYNINTNTQRKHHR